MIQSTNIEVVKGLNVHVIVGTDAHLLIHRRNAGVVRVELAEVKLLAHTLILAGSDLLQLEVQRKAQAADMASHQSQNLERDND